MPTKQHPMEALRAYLPENTFEPVVAYIHTYKVQLTVTKKRKGVLGDYRSNHSGGNHRITVNGDLNKYEFLITLLHELAHLLTYEKYKNRVEPHGQEWKAIFGDLLYEFIKLSVFPEDIEKALKKSMTNPAATANGETELILLLRRYDMTGKPGYMLLANLPDGAVFRTEQGKVFKKIAKRRSRFECVEISTSKRWAFSPLCEVMLVG